MKRNIKKIALVLVLFLAFITKANAESATLKYGSSVPYGSYSTHMYWIDGSAEYNAFCVQPNGATPAQGTYSSTEITTNTTYQGLLAGLYYSYQAPGWDSVKTLYDGSSLCSGGCSEAQYYAWSHVALSWLYYHDIGSSGWTSGLTQAQENEIIGIAGTIGQAPAPTSGFQGFLIETGSSTQNIAYWRNTPTTCGKITKTIAGTSTPLQGAVFGLYTWNGSSYVELGRLTTGNNGVVTFDELDPNTTYYYHEISAPSGYYIDYPDYYELQKSASSCTNNSMTDSKKYYCFRVRKKDGNKEKVGVTELLKNFTFTATGSFADGISSKTTGDSGIVTFFTGEDSSARTVTESSAASGYARSTETKTVTPSQMTQGYGSTDAAGCPASAATIDFTNYKYVINWYKEYESGTKADGATFKVKSGDKYIKTNGTASITDFNGTTKTCYVYDSLVNTIGEASSFTSGANGEAGGVCIQGLDNGSYTVIETAPVAHHTFGDTLSKTVTAATTFSNATIFTNAPTYIEVEKTVTDANRVTVTDAAAAATLEALETSKLRKIPFNIYKTTSTGEITGGKISFVLRNGIYYDLSSPDVTLAAGETATTDLYLNENRKFKLSHLAEGQYIVKEKGQTDGDCVCINDSTCIGYYYPPTDVRFTVTKCSSESSVSASTANQTIGNNTCSVTYNKKGGTVDNHPTELWFTKKDFYTYEDAGDIADQTVDFEDDKERSDFDRIVFKVKDANGNYLKFVDIGAHITDSSKVCLNDNDFREYRYITDEEIQALGSAANNLTIVTELHTCGGHIRITNLCRGKSYTVEEISVPEDSVFILPEAQADRETTYNVSCCDDTTTTQKTTKTVIMDKGTRVRFEKRDSKYNYLIPDETTTFKVYQCEKGTNCHPTDNSSNMASATNVRKIMTFTQRAKLTKKDQDMVIEYDEEDGRNNGSVIQHSTTDYEDSYEVYKAVSDTDLAAGGNFTTDLHPDRGILILRYLPAGYNYVLVETVAPQGYSLPSGRNAETEFRVVNNTVQVEEINRVDIPVSLLVRKYTASGDLLEGAEFTISKAKTCNFNIDANLVETEGGPIKLKTIRDGIYEVRPTGDTTIFRTCADRPGQPCNDINNSLTYSGYTNQFGDFSLLTNSNNERVQIQAGEALIQYLDYGECYLIEETKAPEGYSLPKNAKDRFALVKITDKEEIFDTYESFVNSPTPFEFFKTDEYGNPLDGAKYKLQKLDDNKVYKDVAVSVDTSYQDKLVYKVDPSSTNYIMETKNGKATVTYLEEGQYRVLEVEAPAGYELPKKTMNVATFFVDEKGNVYGSNIIANKPKTETRNVKPKAQATLVVNIQTGQTIIRYGLIIAVIALAISGLIYVQRKNKK